MYSTAEANDVEKLKSLKELTSRQLGLYPRRNRAIFPAISARPIASRTPAHKSRIVRNFAHPVKLSSAPPVAPTFAPYIHCLVVVNEYKNSAACA